MAELADALDLGSSAARRGSSTLPVRTITNLKHNTRNYLLLALAAFLFSTGGAAIKACTLTSWQVASLRSGIAALAMLAMAPAARRNWTLSLGTLPLAAAYAATLILFVAANKLTTSANAIFLQSTGPIYMLLLGPFVLKERIRRVDLVVIASVALGAVLLFSSTGTVAATATNPQLGNILAAISGLTWALTITGLRLIGKRNPAADHGVSVVVTGNLVAFAAALPMALPIAVVHPTDLAVLLYLGIFQIGVAYLALSRGLRHVPGLEAATILLIEPVFNPIWSWAVHNERPGALALLGGGVIVAANLGSTWYTSRR